MKRLACATLKGNPMADISIRRFETAERVRSFDRGRFEVVEIGGLTLGRATYAAGWRWSVDVGAAADQAFCPVEHVGIVVSGRVGVIFPSGCTYELGPGDIFHIGPDHDSWVVGDEPYVSLHLLGAEHYAE